MELTLEVQCLNEKPVLRCHGHVVCGHEAEALAAAIGRLVDAFEHVTVDLKDVRKMDCAGLGTIVACVCLARARGRSVELRSVPAHIKEIIRVTGLQEFINVDEPHSAVAA